MRWALLLLAAGCEFRPDWVPGEVDAGDLEEPPVVPGDDAPAAAQPDAGSTPPPPDAGRDGEEEEGEEFATTLPTVMWDGHLWAWDRNSANSGYPAFSGNEVTLTPNQNDRAGAIFLVEPWSPPFTITFEYRTEDNDGCTGSTCRWASADGFSFMFGKDITAYETGTPPQAEGRGFIADGTGYGIHFELYGNRQISLQNGTLATLDELSAETYSSNWRAVRIEVRNDRAEVFVGGSSYRYDSPDGDWNTTFEWIGFGAGTGGAAATHRIRTVAVESL